MTIHELECFTGITKQNIRFYEKKELLHPVRNSVNNYREYTEDDLATLKMIKILRKLDFSLEDIRKILSQETVFHTALEEHLKELQKRQQELDACIAICKDLLDVEPETLDLDRTLSKMDMIEQNGGKFIAIVKDYKRFATAESRRCFAFKPDSMVMNPTEFMEALLQYANENDLKLVLTKGGMYPTFEIDGVEYTAYRAFDRFGATIHCTMTHPEEAGAGDISSGKKLFFRFLYGPYVGLILLLAFMAVSRHSIGWAVLVAIMVFPVLSWGFPRVK